MIEYSADSYYYLSSLNRADDTHERARSISLKLTGRIVTTAWVIQEVADALSQPRTRPDVLRLISRIEQDPDTILIEPDSVQWREGLDLYRARGDQAWSLTDCISFVIMQQRGIRNALTGDRHFEQAGFTAMLK